MESSFYPVPGSLVLRWLQLTKHSVSSLLEAGREGFPELQKSQGTRSGRDGRQGFQIGLKAEGEFGYHFPLGRHPSAVQACRGVPPRHNCILMELRVKTGMYQEDVQPVQKNVGFGQNKVQILAMSLTLIISEKLLVSFEVLAFSYIKWGSSSPARTVKDQHVTAEGPG